MRRIGGCSMMAIIAAGCQSWCFDSGCSMWILGDSSTILGWSSPTSANGVLFHCGSRELLIRAGNVLVELGMGMNQSELCGKLPCISIILHYLLKEVPTELVSSNAVEILELIECSKDYSFDQVAWIQAF
ncbi:hypothetical protein Acr_23g0009170 [Actinidia rufa]|uniref:Uncharacterized protein n=1 Tax=Actinidia rufa TaxID=165716 RepID=A0A7J0GP06_9ERIC|nr:hypothetical protein Acr_23g0009170 [Actinidia rufa]